MKNLRNGSFSVGKMELEMLPRPVRTLLWIVSGAVFLAGYLATFASIGGPKFLPSPMWAKASLWIVLPLGLLTGAFLLLEIKREKAGRFKNFGPLRRAFLYVLTVLICFCFALFAVTNGVPLLLSQYKGSPVQFEYIVADPIPKRRKYCKSSIKLKEPILALGQIRGVSEEFAAELEDGSTVLISGEGTKLGLYVEQIQVIKGDTL